MANCSDDSRVKVMICFDRFLFHYCSVSLIFESNACDAVESVVYFIYKLQCLLGKRVADFGSYLYAFLFYPSHCVSECVCVCVPF